MASSDARARAEMSNQASEIARLRARLAEVEAERDETMRAYQETIADARQEISTLAETNRRTNEGLAAERDRYTDLVRTVTTYREHATYADYAAMAAAVDALGPDGEETTGGM